MEFLRDITEQGWRRLRRLSVVLCVALLVPTVSWAQQSKGNSQQSRYALVIGNAEYRNSPLKNPVNDAVAMAGKLQALGFKVNLKLNANLSTMMDAIRALLSEGRKRDVRLFYFAGHGVQMKGKNYLVPVDAEGLSANTIGTTTADLGGLIERLSELPKGLNLVILDACRNNPFSSMTIATADGRVVKLRGVNTVGFAPTPAPEGTLVAYATSPGAIAIDGANAENGLYTKHLLAHIETPGLPVEQLFKRVRLAVASETKRRQVPWENNSMVGDFCFKSAIDGNCGAEMGSLSPASAGK